MTQNFIRASGGHVGVRSQRDQGTTVTLYLPRAEGNNEDTSSTNGNFLPDRRGARILVLEAVANLSTPCTISNFAEQVHQQVKAERNVA